MKEAKEVKLVMVGKVIGELTRLKKKNSEDNVVCCLPGGSLRYVVSSGLDEDGDVRIFLDEDYEDSGCYNVEMLSNELHGYDKKARVYLKGCGLLLGLKDCKDLFEYDEGEDVVFCDSIKIGKSEEVSHERREYGRQTGAAKRENIALAILTLGLVVALIYNVYAIIAHSGALWKNILWSVVCLVCAILCSLVLYFSKK